MENELLQLLPHTITVQPYTGYNNDGSGIPGTAVEYRARIVGKVMAVRKDRGVEITNLMTIYVDTTDVISANSKLTLPSEFSGDGDPMIFAVNHYVDEKGMHHAVIQCGWMYHGQRSY